ncbi:hypothetical protein [Marinoscillum furvescens]|nr:hypothetical protein [Marinoscillum furvescens]
MQKNMLNKLNPLKSAIAALSVGLLLGCESEQPAPPDPSAVSFDESSVIIAENSAAQSITLNLDIPATQTIAITLEVTSENAVYGEHYTSTPDASAGSVTLEVLEGEQTATFSIAPVDNEAIDDDKLIVIKPTALGEISLSGAAGISVFIENDEVSTLLLAEDFDNFKVVDNNLNNAFIMDSWIQVNGNGQAFTEASADQTISGFVGNGVGGSLTFDNSTDSETGTTFLNVTRRFLESDVTTSLDDQTYKPNTYYCAFNFTLNELEAATGVRRYLSLGKVIYDGDNTQSEASSVASEWGAKMAIKGVVENDVQKYYFGLHKRIGVGGIWGDLVVPEGAKARELGATYLVVLKVVQTDNEEADQGVEPTAEQSNSEAYLYVFEEGEDFTTEPATPYAVDTAGGDVNINAVILLGDQNKHAAAFDGIRVANDWRSLFAQ